MPITKNSSAAEHYNATATPAIFAETVTDGRWKMAPHLACLDRELTEAVDSCGRLIVTMPPRHGKSMLCSEVLPAWFLGWNPDARVMLGSYEANFAASWGRKARRILEEWGWLFGVSVSKDSSAAERWDIAGREGGMQTAGIGGAFTGKGADLMIVDDPVKGYEQAHSETWRNKTWDWFLADAYTRLSPTGVVIVIQTRWHEDDLTGRLIEDAKNGGEQYKIVNLPAIAEENDGLGRLPGEALWPARYPLEKLATIRRTLGSYRWNSLYQQHPQPMEGGMFKREWFQIANGIPLGSGKAVRYWDLAATQNDGDYSASGVVTEIDGIFYIDKVVRGQWSSLERQKITDAVASMDRDLFGHDLVTWLPQDPAAAGKQVAELESRRLASQGFAVKYELVSGKKEVRAMPFAAACEAGIVRLVKGKWNHDFIEEFCAFPTGSHDDMVDAICSAFNKVAKPRQRFEIGVYG
jgi:predicted phage terminase large subunit-like protein